MEKRPFGPAKQRIAAIGQGTWYSNRERREDAVQALREGLARGLTHIDTAEMYLSGAAEEWVAEAIDSHRDEVFLVSKVLPENASARGTIEACERSLRRLRTDRLDCYLLHWRGRHPLAETITAFEKLRASGKIVSWGVSNFDVDDLRELRDAGSADGPACNQVLYHLQERAIEHEVMPWCNEHRVAVVAYSPFDHDRFPGPHTAGGKVPREIANARDATPHQVALQFLLRDPNVMVIPKASSMDHMRENAAAATLQLSSAEIARIDASFPRGSKPRSLPMI